MADNNHRQYEYGDLVRYKGDDDRIEQGVAGKVFRRNDDGSYNVKFNDIIEPVENVNQQSLKKMVSLFRLGDEVLFKTKEQGLIGGRVIGTVRRGITDRYGNELFIEPKGSIDIDKMRLDHGVTVVETFDHCFGIERGAIVRQHEDRVVSASNKDT